MKSAVKITLSMTMMFVMLTLVTGCVERLIKVTSNPPGAVVWLNDQEIGSTPITVPFTWYGEYSVVLRKEGYEPVLTSVETPTPFYQWPVLDFFSECLLPVDLVDEHNWDFELEAAGQVDSNRLIIRGERMRIQAQTQGKESAGD
ncbi:MAG: PEGA domain-containing protein [Sedimentisphaerales bacterium]|nr:PEGA domain-containing protein [Sedimentisphaerales bacterium]MBN2842673.1 PEGA domain-containing protein [Sedimentisphaerales bacterium]